MLVYQRVNPFGAIPIHFRHLLQIRNPVSKPNLCTILNFMGSNISKQPEIMVPFTTPSGCNPVKPQICRLTAWNAGRRVWATPVRIMRCIGVPIKISTVRKTLKGSMLRVFFDTFTLLPWVGIWGRCWWNVSNYKWNCTSKFDFLIWL